MIVGIIEQDRKIFYIYMKENQEKLYLSIVLENKNEARVLKQEEAKFLLKTLLASKLEYKESKDGFDIYIDESGNQRFYKNGLENYLMFYYNNGVTAVLNELKNANNKNIKDKIKRFSITVGAFVFGVTLSAIAIEEYQKNVETNGVINYLLDEKLSKKAEQSKKSINLDECKDLIYSSEFLSDEDKEFLYNEDLLSDVLTIADNTRNYDLREKLNNIKINKFSEVDDSDVLGYYMPQNEIYVSDTISPNKRMYKKILGHEYIHLLQSNNKYLYIKEACAEIIMSEYLIEGMDSYHDEVCNVKVLMELIGPEPILECNFKNDTSLLENEIKQYLEPEDADKLLSLLCTGAYSFEKTVNLEIQSLLEKMYTNMIDQPKPSKEMIEKIYSNYDLDRVYFNQSKREYEKDFVLERNVSNTQLENIIIYDNIPDWSLIFNDKVFQKKDVYDSKYVDYSSIEKYEYEIEDNIYEITDLVDYGDNNEFIDNLINLYDNNLVENMKIYYKDGTVGDVVKLTDIGIFVNRYNLEEKTEPSIKKRFDFQIDRSLYKNNSDMKEYNKQKNIDDSEKER